MSFRLKIRKFAITSAVLLAFAPAAFAVDADTQPGGTEERRFRMEDELNELERLRDKVAEAEPEIEEEMAAPKSGPSARFTLKKVEISGNQQISSAELEQIASGYKGRKVDFNDLTELARKLKEHYRAKGYVAAYVYLPPQNVKDGVVEFKVVEGRLGEISIEGNKWYSDRSILRHVNLDTDHVISMDRLRRDVSFINESPDVKARAVLKPGKKPKSTDIVFKVKDRVPLHVNTDVSNVGTDNTGKHRWGAGVEYNNLLGRMDKLSGRVQLGKGVVAVGSDYNVPINRHHTRAGFSFTHATVDVGGDFRALDIKGEATTYGVYLLQPVLFWKNIAASLNTGFDWKSIENRALGNRSGRDELRILNVGANVEESDRYGRTISPHSFHFGFADMWGSSGKVDPGATRALTGGQFFIYRGSLTRYHRLPFGMMYSLRGVTQLTPDRLPPSEELRLGGAFSVRGYPEGEYLADNGAYLTQEFFVPSYFFPEDWQLPFAQKPLREQIQGVAFFDFGGGRLKRSLATEDHAKFLAGLGGGVRIHLYDKIFGRFQWAGRVGDRSSDGSNSAFYYGIQAEIL